MNNLFIVKKLQKPAQNSNFKLHHKKNFRIRFSFHLKTTTKLKKTSNTHTRSKRKFQKLQQQNTYEKTSAYIDLQKRSKWKHGKGVVAHLFFVSPFCFPPVRFSLQPHDVTARWLFRPPPPIFPPPPGSCPPLSHLSTS